MSTNSIKCCMKNEDTDGCFCLSEYSILCVSSFFLVYITIRCLNHKREKFPFTYAKSKENAKIFRKFVASWKNDGNCCAKGFRKLSLNPDNLFEQESDLLQIGLSTEKEETIVRFTISIKDWWAVALEWHTFFKISDIYILFQLVITASFIVSLWHLLVRWNFLIKFVVHWVI